MNFDRIAGTASAVGVVLIWAIVAWLGVAGPVWRASWTASPEQWLGFAGAIAGALATIAAGGAALFAAYKTLRPVKDQLNQLIKQNDYILYDRLRKRAADLNEEIILIEQICSQSVIVDQAFRGFVQTGGHFALKFPHFEASVDRFNSLIGDLQKKRGDIWGAAKIQFERRVFIDHCLMMGAMTAHMILGARLTQHLSPVTLKSEMPAWEAHRSTITKLGDAIYAHVTAETESVSRAISELESRLFGR